MTLIKNLQSVKSQLPQDVCLVAVSKTKPQAMIQELWDAGQLDFGENKVQELVEKHEALPKGIRWHMIGHLQRNKVKYIAGFVHLIHGVDSERLLKEIDKRAAQNNRVIDVLLQAHIAQESSKFGFDLEYLEAKLIREFYEQYSNVRIKGLMGMASLTEDEGQIKREFSSLNERFLNLKREFPDMDILSMGMSGDYPLAIECGSNMVRVGSKIFGSRN